MGWVAAWLKKTKLQISCPVMTRRSLQPTALKKNLISSLAVLATSLLPIRELNPFTADVITASGSNCAGTNKHRLSEAAGGPREAGDESIYKHQWCGEWR